MEKFRKRVTKKKIILMGLGTVIIILILILMAIIILKIQNDEEEQREIETNKNGEQSERRVLGNFSIIIPKTYETSDSNNENYKRYSKSEKNDYCYVVIKKTEKGSYESGKDYLEKNIYIGPEDKASEYKDKEIKESKWTNINITTEEGNIEHYAIKETNEIYSIEYYVDKDSEKCQEEKEEMIKTMEMEKLMEE